eukprot:167886_1
MATDGFHFLFRDKKQFEQCDIKVIKKYICKEHIKFVEAYVDQIKRRFAQEDIVKDIVDMILLFYSQPLVKSKKERDWKEQKEIVSLCPVNICATERRIYKFTFRQAVFDELMDKKVFASALLRFGDREKLETIVKFYFQINYIIETTRTENGRISLILHKFGAFNPEKKSITISGDFFCQQMNNYWARFDSQTLILGGDESDSRLTFVFDWDSFVKAFKEKQSLDWILSIQKAND